MGYLLSTLTVGIGLIDLIFFLISFKFILWSIFSSTANLVVIVLCYSDGNLICEVDRFLFMDRMELSFYFSFENYLDNLSLRCRDLRDPGSFLRGSNLTLSLFFNLYLFKSIQISYKYIDCSMRQLIIPITYMKFNDR